ncbi:MAG: hypothetical protein H7240_02275 [Glaciimonas sp.]|nr:hypothetical protein [Glaciimonas sp.]
MHHNPVPVGTSLIDACDLKNNEGFLSVLEKNSEIKLVLCSHVYGDYKIYLKEQMIEAGPATCFRGEKGNGELKTENRRGFKIFDFIAASYRSKKYL